MERVRGWYRALSSFSLRRWFIGVCTRLLTVPLKSYELRVPNNITELRKSLHKGDVLLVEGDQRVSQVIRYLTQSSWSHAALYVGDELLRGDPAVARETQERFGEESRFLLIEAVEGDGVTACPLSKYEHYNIRVCRPQGLRREDVATVIRAVASHRGDAYDVMHIIALARYFFPVSLVPRRWRRAALHFGSGSEREVICSSMIAKGFALVGYPIMPRVTVDPTPRRDPWWPRLVRRNSRRSVARFRRQAAALVTPRDFDLSPYFEIIKFNHLAGQSFNYREIVWEEERSGQAEESPPIRAAG